MNGVIERQQFAGNKLPGDRLDPLAKIYAGLFPEANTTPLPGTNNQNNYIYSISQPEQQQ